MPEETIPVTTTPSTPTTPTTPAPTRTAPRPYTLARSVGVELEVAAPGRREAYEMIVAVGVPATLSSTYGSRSHAYKGKWKVEPDSSVQGCEIASPPIRDLSSIETVCYALRQGAVPASVNAACGLHVHVDARDLTWRDVAKVATAWAQVQNALWTIVPASRRPGANRFCAPVPWSHSNMLAVVRSTEAPDMDSLASNNGYPHSLLRQAVSNRNYSLNIAAISKHGTIEFRSHSGTTNARKVQAWARLCERLVRSAVANMWDYSADCSTLEGALDEILRPRPWERPVVTYQRARARPIVSTLLQPVATYLTARYGASPWPAPFVHTSAMATEALNALPDMPRQLVTQGVRNWRNAEGYGRKNTLRADQDRVDLLTADRAYFLSRATEFQVNRADALAHEELVATAQQALGAAANDRDAADSHCDTIAGHLEALRAANQWYSVEATLGALQTSVEFTTQIWSTHPQSVGRDLNTSESLHRLILCSDYFRFLHTLRAALCTVKVRVHDEGAGSTTAERYSIIAWQSTIMKLFGECAHAIVRAYETRTRAHLNGLIQRFDAAQIEYTTGAPDCELIARVEAAIVDAQARFTAANDDLIRLSILKDQAAATVQALRTSATAPAVEAD